jgi:hypothetical protein
VDAGPLGYLSIAAHGHADALSLTLSIAGEEMLIDSGTFSYGEQPKWRDHFRGTSAHNTVRVDGVDQSVSGGAFLWMKHAQAACVAFESTETLDRWEGTHSGYSRLPDPVVHRRAIEFDKPLSKFTVTDRLECKQAHRVEIFWHLAPDCVVEMTPQQASVVKGNAILRIRLRTPGLAFQLAQGEGPRLEGWSSTRYGTLIASPTLICAGEVVGDCQIVTEMTVEILSQGPK